jgi:hypothetical protein
VSRSAAGSAGVRWASCVASHVPRPAALAKLPCRWVELRKYRAGAPLRAGRDQMRMRAASSVFVDDKDAARRALQAAFLGFRDPWGTLMAVSHLKLARA